ncbi:MAG: PIN domain-containing protein [Candidatus Acidiferrum sp.]
MKYLLDVSALVALGVLQHEFHLRAKNWVRSLATAQQPELLTCSITELGFVRIVVPVSQYGLTLGQAQSLLVRVKEQAGVKFTFISDDHDATRLPTWVKGASQITDGHLLELAKAHGANLATLDAKIPRSFLIPPEK